MTENRPGPHRRARRRRGSQESGGWRRHAHHSYSPKPPGSYGRSARPRRRNTTKTSKSGLEISLDYRPPPMEPAPGEMPIGVGPEGGGVDEDDEDLFRVAR